MSNKTFVPSPQQQAVFDWVDRGYGSAFVEAVAGAGKTTTLIEALKKMRGSVAFVAYNKKIADEIKEKVAKLDFGNRVRVGTFHSFGYNAWKRIHPNVRIEADEKADRIREHLNSIFAINDEGKHSLELEGEVFKLFPFVQKLVSLAKQRVIGVFGHIDDESLWFDIVDHFDLAYEIEDEALIEKGIEMAISALRFSTKIAPEIIDFDDMLYMPLISGCKMWENTWLLVDEAQDTNPARRALARKMLWAKGRAIFVGDRHQAIYGFTGADNDAVDQIMKDFRCKILPLTVTYRCPKEVVKMANTVVSHIQAHDTAPEGQVSELAYDEFWKINDLTPTDAVLCRNTKPLVEMAFALIRRGIACHVEGREIGAGLIKLADRYKAKDLDELRDKLEDFRTREVQKLIAKGKETQAQGVEDRVDTILILADKVHTIDGLKDTINSMFKDTDGKKPETLTLSTIHKSKGREWDRVFILGYYELMPSSFARQEWQIQQEYNLMYVGVTRAKDRLATVALPPKSS